MKFKLVRDEHGFVKAIECDGYYLTHLVPGTVRNEATAEDLVAVLNKAWYVSQRDPFLRRALDAYIAAAKETLP